MDTPVNPPGAMLCFGQADLFTFCLRLCLQEFRMIRDGNWEMAEQLSQSVHGFIPALFKKQEKFWEMKDQALADVIRKRISMSAYDFCHNLEHVNRKENTLSRFFFRGLMLSDLQYTSYN